jgi:hypothetical protein
MDMIFIGALLAFVLLGYALVAGCARLGGAQ